MANVLKMALSEAILSLHQRGWSRRRIARELGIDRATVKRHLRAQAAQPNAPNAARRSSGPSDGAPSQMQPAPIGSGASESDSNAASAPIGTPAPNCAAEQIPVEAKPIVEATDGGDGRPGGARDQSACSPWRATILAKLDQGLTAQRIYQDLASEHGYAGSYYSVVRFVRRLGKSRTLPFRRMECGPGEEAQVDFGTGAPFLTPERRRRRPHIFRIVLSHSRKGYTEAVTRQTTENFVRCLENAFWHFGGVPKTLVIDNLRAAVSKADWYDPELNPKVQSFCRHYGTTILPTKPRMPRHKGKIERGVGYVKSNALKGHLFASLADENRHLQHWEASVADTRVHGTTRQQVGKLFMAEERACLQPLPAGRFPSFCEGRRVVHRDGHVEVAKAYYSVPPEYLGRSVWARWNGHLVRIFNEKMQSIAVHAQREPGKFSTHPQHIPLEKISPVEHGAEWLLIKASRLGTQTTRWAEAMIQTRGVAGVRVLYGLLNLAKRFPSEQIDHACGIAHGHGAYRLRVIRALLKRQEIEQPCFDFMNEHPLIRPLSEYANLIHHSFQKEIS